VLLHDPGEHNQSDERIDIQFAAEYVESEHRAQASGRKSGKNRQRMDIAFVEHTQHDVNHKHCHQEQSAEIRYRVLKRLRIPAESRTDVGGQGALGQIIEFICNVAQRNSRFQIERHVYGWKLALVLNTLRTNVFLVMGDGIERYQQTVFGLEIDFFQIIG